MLQIWGHKVKVQGRSGIKHAGNDTDNGGLQYSVFHMEKSF